MGGRREKRGWDEGEEAAGGGRGEKKREGGKRGKIYAREARATPKREERDEGWEWEVRGREGERPPPSYKTNHIVLGEKPALFKID